MANLGQKNTIVSKTFRQLNYRKSIGMANKRFFSYKSVVYDAPFGVITKVFEGTIFNYLTPWELSYPYSTSIIGKLFQGYIAGNVKVEGYKEELNIVRLYQKRTGILAKSYLTDEEGRFRFDGLDQNIDDYYITSNHNGFNGIIFDSLTPYYNFPQGAEPPPERLGDELLSMIVDAAPLLWYDPMDFSTLTLVSGNISGIQDKSGNSRHGYNATTRPSLDAGSILFDVAGECIHVTTPYAGTQNLFIVLEPNDNKYVTIGSTSPSYYELCGEALSNPVGTSGATYNLNGASSGWTTRNHTLTSLGNTVSIVELVGMNTTSWPGLDFGDYGPSYPDYAFLGRIREIVSVPNNASLGVREKVTGVLAHRHNIAHKLPDDHPYKNTRILLAPGSSGALTVEKMRPHAWYDANDPTTISNGGANWNDKSVNARHLALTTGSPNVRSMGMNGRTTMGFDGSTYYQTAGAFDLGGDPVLSIFFVFRKTDSGLYGGPISWGTSGMFAAFGLGQLDATSLNFMYYGGGLSGAGFPVNTISNMRFTKTPGGISTTARCYRDSIDISNLGNSQSNTPNISNTAFTVGSWIGYGGYGFIGDISEIIVFNRTLSYYETVFLDGFLAHKWGVNSNLPENHLHFNMSPVLL